LNDNDYNNFNPSFVKHDANKLRVPEYPQILEQLKREQEEKEKEDKGFLSYYIEKYAPIIVGAVAVAMVAPSILSARRSQPAVSGKKENGLLLLGLVGTGIYLATRKNNTPEVLRKTEQKILIENI